MQGLFLLLLFSMKHTAFHYKKARETIFTVAELHSQRKKNNCNTAFHATACMLGPVFISRGWRREIENKLFPQMLLIHFFYLIIHFLFKKISAVNHLKRLR